MAIIACGECGKSISSQAPACIHCGAPVVASAVVTIQQTRKAFKGAQLAGLGVALLGVLVATATEALRVGGWLVVLGLTAWLLARLAAWWNHG